MSVLRCRPSKSLPVLVWRSPIYTVCKKCFVVFVVLSEAVDQMSLNMESGPLVVDVL